MSRLPAMPETETEDEEYTDEEYDEEEEDVDAMADDNYSTASESRERIENMETVSPRRFDREKDEEHIRK